VLKKLIWDLLKNELKVNSYSELEVKINAYKHLEEKAMEEALNAKNLINTY
jgi:flagellar biosynthesis chaperone FliJ